MKPMGVMCLACNLVLPAREVDRHIGSRTMVFMLDVAITPTDTSSAHRHQAIESKGVNFFLLDIESVVRLLN